MEEQFNPNYLLENGITSGQLMNAVRWWELALRAANLRLPLQRHYTDEYIGKFGSVLMLEIMSDANILRHGIVTDYQPVGVLREAALKVGISIGVLSPFPWKTRMVFVDGGIHVQMGEYDPWIHLMKTSTEQAQGE